MQEFRTPKKDFLSAEQISQFPSSVIAFSSQYGSENGSYSANQLIGTGSGPSVYPRYGDFCEACVLRYYGKWWSLAPSAQPPVGTVPNCYPVGYCAEDFVEVAYPQPVYLTSVRVYETFMPGCIVGIHARTTSDVVSPAGGRWHRVWHRASPSREPHLARIFEPTLSRLPRQPVDQLRLEFNSTLAEYYTELDTVELIGTARPPPTSAGASAGDAGELCQQVQSMCISVLAGDDQAGVGSSSSAGEEAGWFSRWPPELLARLLTFLDLASLLQLGQTCQLLAHYCSDPLLYRSLSLRPYCLRLDDAGLGSLAGRVSAARQLDLSWCSSFGAAALCNFLLATGSCLTTLRLASCGRLDDGCMGVIASHCRSLEDLDLSGSPKRVSQSGFAALSTGLTRLTRLKLYRCGIAWQPLAALIAANRGLRHLNLGACPVLAESGDLAASALGASCRDLRSVDLWRSRSLSCAGLTALADGCPSLEELDLGWCSKVQSASGCFAHLAQRCRGLRKLFLTANRTVQDIDLHELAKHCKQLRQLDILGTNSVSLTAIVHVLQSCPKMEMLDVSFCGGIKRGDVDALQPSFPHCAIQMSFQN